MVDIELEPVASDFSGPDRAATPAGRSRKALRAVVRSVASAVTWLFGLASLVVALSVLAAIPIVQFLTLGYFLESSARVARTGRLRDGLIGVRRAAGAGGFVAGTIASLVPMALIRSQAHSADLIDPGGPIAGRWRVTLVLATAGVFLHLLAAFGRGARLRHFLWPVGSLAWLGGAARRPVATYVALRDALWAYATGLRPGYYFRLGLVGFAGTLAWLVPPAALISAGGQWPLVGVVGAAWLSAVVTFLPFLQVRYATEGSVGALFRPGAVRDRFRRAPWAFAFALLVLLLASIPLYLLKIEMVPREAAWLPSLVFVVFLAPARLLTGWAYARSGRRERARNWAVRTLGRLAIVPVALFYVLVVFLSQYTSWGGVASLYDQHAFLLPVPFLDMN